MTKIVDAAERLDDALRQAALDYHALPQAGKIATATTKPLTDARELALA